MRNTDLQSWLELARQETGKGKLPSYIPLLAKANPRAIAIAIQQVNGDYLSAGDTELTFPLMSVVKPFLLLYLLEKLGEKQVFALVNRQATSQPFNSIPDGKPHNPMINAGAIAIASLLDSCEALQNWLNQQSGAQLTLDSKMLASVRSMPNRRNLEIAAQLQSLGIMTDPEQALAIYEEICCLRANVHDLAKMGNLLTQQSPSISIVLEIMTTCGMYEASANFADMIGLPSKSSISGALLSIVPHQIAIACYSPVLDTIGNSVAGVFLLKKIKAWITT
ncbi:glutaminase [Pseudanabaena mucicola]|uniref:glutaminase n=1 Tax=Pseudanabaena mucicola FACHB-723 TaxID=2692860 RepID=A0ABR8A1M5_9CYAN|nr:glutaminase [Pseudanabaena mucicola]MBD2189252.1 glutaminase [Pseudanabaena mucicola FACHB-723]